MRKPAPRVIVFAGPNGAGKTMHAEGLVLADVYAYRRDRYTQRNQRLPREQLHQLGRAELESTGASP